MLYSFHLTSITRGAALSLMLEPPQPASVPGLRAIEAMTMMTLGSPILSRERMRLGNLVLFAVWESEQQLESYLHADELGEALGAGWHVRLELVRRWGSVREFAHTPSAAPTKDEEPVVAVTLARAKLTEIPRFIRVGKPVEALVRDCPGSTLSLAAFRPPLTFSTFSIWRTQREMLDMVQGRIHASEGGRHAAAMTERRRRDFHFEFTTLRFRALSEHGAWQGRSGFVPLKPPRV